MNENSETFNFGVKDGVRGFFTNPSRADDSFIPFKSGGSSYPDILLYSNCSVSIPVNGNKLSFNMKTNHPYINFYVDKLANGTVTNLFTQLAGGTYNGTKTFDISGSDIIRFRSTPYDAYGNIGNIFIDNIEIE